MQGNLPQSTAMAAQAERLEALAREFRPALTRYFRKRSFQQADVDDLVQEVLVRLAVRGDSGSIKQPESYLLHTATNVWRDFLRKKRTHAQDAHEEYLEERHAREDCGPDQVLEGRESIDAVISSLNELPERTRQIFILCRVEGMRQKGVARRLGISVSAIEKHMIRAIAHLAVSMEIMK